ncbi:uncharacterized protein [Apostichopus japonicus]|uniref:uncharacterized protein isoform X4 n=1 Tax=Stichopus japonicus TaxID=307972 RepID=UPI003AB46A8A
MYRNDYQLLGVSRSNRYVLISIWKILATSNVENYKSHELRHTQTEMKNKKASGDKNGVESDISYNISSSFGKFRGSCIAKCVTEAKSNDDDCWQADCPTTVEEYDQICSTIGCPSESCEGVPDIHFELSVSEGTNLSIWWPSNTTSVTFYQFDGSYPNMIFLSEISQILNMSDGRILQDLSVLSFEECGLAWRVNGAELCKIVEDDLRQNVASNIIPNGYIHVWVHSVYKNLIDGFTVDVVCLNNTSSHINDGTRYTSTGYKLSEDLHNLPIEWCEMFLQFQSQHCNFVERLKIHEPSKDFIMPVATAKHYCTVSVNNVSFHIVEDKLVMTWDNTCLENDKLELIFLNWGHLEENTDFTNSFKNRKEAVLSADATSYTFEGIKPGIEYGFQIFYVFDNSSLQTIKDNYHTKNCYRYTVEEKSLLWFKFLGVFGGIFIALYLLGLLWFIYHRSTSTKNKVQRSEQSIQNVYDDHPSRNTSRKSSATSDHLTLSDFHKSVMLADHWEFDPMRLRLGTSLGKGAFGQVVEGFLEGRSCVRQSSKSGWEWVPQDTGNKDVLKVAVKLLKDFASDAQKQEFLQEIQMMKHLGYHPNVVCLIGCCTVMDPVCLVVETCPQGDLKKYLLTSRSKILARLKEENLEIDDLLTSADLLSFARQITMGMEYLSQKGYVHRDLAARNVLVSDNKSLKIADFGLTRYIYEERQYVGKKGARIPVKWMSIEAIIDGVYTTESDVWSFGVILYEIITLGGEPYPGIVNRDLPKMLCSGFRMERPEQCPDDWYTMMLDCWHETPKQRPNFSKLRLQLEAMLEESTPYLSLYPSQAHIFHCLDDIREESDEVDSASEAEPMLDDSDKVVETSRQQTPSTLNLSRSGLTFDSPDEKDESDSVIEGDVEEDNHPRKELNGSVEYVNTGRQISTESNNRDELILSLLSSPDSCDSGVAVDNKFLYDSKGQPIEYDGVEQMV